MAPLVAGSVTAALLRSSHRWPRRLREPLDRTNFAGRPVTLAEGPSWVLGTTTACVCAGDVIAAVVTAAPGAVGLADDLVGDADVKGLAGHLGALRRGRLTSGSVKIGGIALTGLAAALVEHRARETRSGRRDLLQLGVDAALVAGAANLVNLFDLRPGRALKVAAAANLLLLPAPTSPRPALLAALAASASVAPADLAGQTMLGDCGANASGALVGQAAVRTLPSWGRAAALVGVVGLTLASERVSFSEVIDANPTLRALDRWGRRTPAAR